MIATWHGPEWPVADLERAQLVQFLDLEEARIMKQPVLVVDDDPVMREMVSELLGERGYSVDTAGSAEDALDKLGEVDFACVLTDLQMPGMNGMELLGAVRERCPDTPTVMMTARQRRFIFHVPRD